MFVHVPTPPPPSKNAKALAAKITQLVRILREEDPSIKRSEALVGLRLAQTELRRELAPGRERAVVVGVLIVAALVILGVVLAKFLR